MAKILIKFKAPQRGKYGSISQWRRDATSAETHSATHAKGQRRAPHHKQEEKKLLPDVAVGSSAANLRRRLATFLFLPHHLSVVGNPVKSNDQQIAAQNRFVG